MKTVHRIFILITFLLFLVLGATLGYTLILDIGFIDSLYMTIITISTVGYGEVAPMNDGAKLFSILIIVMSVGTVGFVLSQLGSFFKKGYLSESWRQAKMQKTIEQLKNHYIICGSGETGTYIIQQFMKRNVPFVVIDHDPETIEWFKDRDILHVQGDATHETILEEARIEHAKGIVATLSKDADNVYVALTARQMNTTIHIVARAIDENAHAKLKRAGANFTVSPNEIGGRKMAAMLLKPSTTYFMDSLIHTDEMTLDLEEIAVQKESALCNQTIKDAKISTKTGLIILAIRKEKEEKFKFNPKANTLLEVNDKLIVVGEETQIDALRNLAKDISDE